MDRFVDAPYIRRSGVSGSENGSAERRICAALPLITDEFVTMNRRQSSTSSESSGEHAEPA